MVLVFALEVYDVIVPSRSQRKAALVFVLAGGLSKRTRQAEFIAALTLFSH